MRFVAIDVETANSRYHSICQIGVVLFEDGREVAAERVMIDPREEFGYWQTRVHGLCSNDVAGFPCFTDHFGWLQTWLAGQTVISHSHFDRSALRLACDLHRLRAPSCKWIDSSHVALAAWPGIAKHGLGLKVIASQLGIRFRHHDALEDARASGLIVQRAMTDTGLGIAEILKRRLPSIEVGSAGKSVARVGDGTGALVGERIVFTGELTIARQVAADMAAEAGGDVQANVTKATTMLVVGERDLMPGWNEKSGKQRKAEDLIENGFPLRIVGENDFVAFAAITE